MDERELLSRPTYGVGQAAALLGLNQAMVKRWLDGYENSGTAYPPVVRPETSGSTVVTWGEFIELGYVREYRRAKVSLQKLRPVVDRLRAEYNTLYPLGLLKPLVADRELVLSIQEGLDLPQQLAFVVRSGQTIAMADNAHRFFKKIDFDEYDVAGRIRPAGKLSPVAIDPKVAFGEPQVEGVGTARLWELYDAGEKLEDLAEGYELPEHDIRAGIAYEEQFRTLAA